MLRAPQSKQKRRPQPSRNHHTLWRQRVRLSQRRSSRTIERTPSLKSQPLSQMPRTGQVTTSSPQPSRKHHTTSPTPSKTLKQRQFPKSTRKQNSSIKYAITRVNNKFRQVTTQLSPQATSRRQQDTNMCPRLHQTTLQPKSNQKFRSNLHHMPRQHSTNQPVNRNPSRPQPNTKRTTNTRSRHQRQRITTRYQRNIRHTTNKRTSYLQGRKEHRMRHLHRGP